MPQISEQELLGMPASDYMNEKQLSFFQEYLLELKSDLLTEVEQGQQAIATTKLALADDLDRAAAEQENQQRLRFTGRKNLLLRKIQRALEKIKDGSYGYCEISGDPIGLRRLLIRPTAELSFEEKARQEILERNYSKRR
ncbi:RNA polymerase-binding protein DksA [Microbulbifer sp. A4B17]|uniref:TraR/DksA family transcriptional regulator n=1 Tax=Microbulbifer sp. A4B17 TaxID=359370 RepID=UPI000D52E80E|nr:TraR/DksA C4-type zinc finger protein [Microbulbifer sp. A4B17]AWF81204.1 RNA polymerase-binding protein DksA [Microbulbifer sp. A4B17]